MDDLGTRATDEALRRTKQRIEQTYRQAEREVAEKLKSFEEKYAKRDQEYQEQLAQGKISKADYDAWRRGQVFQGEQWKARMAAIQQVLLNADKTAMQIINEDKVDAFISNANYTGYELEQRGHINIGFTLYDQGTVSRLMRDEPDLLPRPEVAKEKSYEWYNHLMHNAVTQGIIQGEDIRQIARRIGETTGERQQSAMMRNARTAFVGAQNAGRIEGLHQAQRLGVKVKKRWTATLDDRTRDAHADLDGQVQEVDDPFESELGDIMYPGDANAAPGNVYNCRCTLTYVYPDYPAEAETRRDNETGAIIDYMSYKQWEAMKHGEVKQQTHQFAEGRDALYKHQKEIVEQARQ